MHSIAAYLEKLGHSVQVEDCLSPYAAPSTEETVRRILKHDPALVGFSTTTSGFLDACDLAGCLKSIRPDIQTVCGGVHVSAMGGDLLQHFQEIDYLCLGEGEKTLAELSAETDPADILGLAFRNNGSVQVNQPREHIADLDTLPFPAYEKLPGFPSKYHLPLFSYIKSPGATMITSRGSHGSYLTSSTMPMSNDSIPIRNGANGSEKESWSIGTACSVSSVIYLISYRPCVPSNHRRNHSLRFEGIHALHLLFVGFSIYTGPETLFLGPDVHCFASICLLI
jgi:hypothetical protein